MEYIWNIFEISLNYIWNIFEISLKYLRNIFEISLKYLWNTFRTFLKYLWNIFRISINLETFLQCFPLVNMVTKIIYWWKTFPSYLSDISILMCTQQLKFYNGCSINSCNRCNHDYGHTNWKEWLPWHGLMCQEVSNQTDTYEYYMISYDTYEYHNMRFDSQCLCCNSS